MIEHQQQRELGVAVTMKNYKIYPPSFCYTGGRRLRTEHSINANAKIEQRQQANSNTNKPKSVVSETHMLTAKTSKCFFKLEFIKLFWLNF